MPFGQTNAPAVFQDLVNQMLLSMLNCSLFLYVDDIEPIQVQHVRQVLQRLLRNVSFTFPQFHSWGFPEEKVGIEQLANTFHLEGGPMLPWVLQVQ